MMYVEGRLGNSQVTAQMWRSECNFIAGSFFPHLHGFQKSHQAAKLVLQAALPVTILWALLFIAYVQLMNSK